jgi:hypothetical protein
LAIMSQVAKSASALVRAFLAILVLELEDMVVRLVRPPNSPAFMAIVGQFAWVSRLTSGVPPTRLAAGCSPRECRAGMLLAIRVSTSL